MNILAPIATKVVMKLAEAAYDERSTLIPSVQAQVFLRRTRVRVAMSNLLCIRDGDRYLLTQNLHRVVSYAPFGGVLKHNAAGTEALAELEWIPHILDQHKDEMHHDIRGFLPGKKLPKFLKWFASKKNREANCVMRELDEETRELGLDEDGHPPPSVPPALSFRHVRSVHEPLTRPLGEDYMQYRLFEVFELNEEDPATLAYREALFKFANKCKRLLVAPSSEILRRRMGSHVIAAHSSYLFQATPNHDAQSPLPSR